MFLVPFSKVKTILFIVLVLSLGWIGFLFDLLLKNPFSQGLGMLLFILAPLLLAVVLRGFNRAEWTDSGIGLHLKGNLKWYGLALFLYPALAAVMITLGSLFGAYSEQKITSMPFAQYIALLAPLLLQNFVKNIFEEFGWRGFLVPRLFSQRNKLSSHLIVGAVWSLWHLPYWFFFLSQDILQKTGVQNKAVFIFVSIISINLFTILFNELRLITKSVWPPLLLHMMMNAITAFMLLNSMLTYKPNAAIIFGLDSLVIAGILACIGLILYNSRQKIKSA